VEILTGEGQGKQGNTNRGAAIKEEKY